ncbi:hypothetical protein L1987_79666 [Smallanthus sonchifolius]|uniref:Uncharacterized protein n=1 Tax=Smallanthus sonchifolius TaxID=185202 RepID=A0ACB8YKG9_9ASTR|nr:hypothetical protein L1987_79666 [Smallanthus sonchifolius]
MPILCCFTPFAGKNKKIKEENDDKILQVRLQHLGKQPIDKVDPKSTFNVDVPISIPKRSTCNVKVVSHGSPAEPQVQENEEVAYEAEDEHERDNHSKSELQVSIGKMPIQEQDEYKNTNLVDHHNYCSDTEIYNNGHLSDPGPSKEAFLFSLKLKRSCSNL